MQRAGDETRQSGRGHSPWTDWRGEDSRVLVVSGSQWWRYELAQLLALEGHASQAMGWDEMPAERLDRVHVAVADLTRSHPAVGAIAGLRTRTPIPILAVVPAVVRERDLVEIYTAGVDQVVLSGVGGREVVARIRALLRRTPLTAIETDQPIVNGDSVHLDRGAGVVTVAGTDLQFTPRECELLGALLRKPGAVVTRAQLAGPTRSRRADAALDALVRGMREKLEVAEGRRRIVTVRGVGFRFLRDAELEVAAGPLGPGGRAGECSVSGAPTPSEQFPEAAAEPASSRGPSARIHP